MFPHVVLVRVFACFHPLWELYYHHCKMLVIASIGAASSQSDGAATVVMSVMVGMVVFAGLIVLCSGVYWMAAFDKEKRALHDRISGTRVVKK